MRSTYSVDDLSLNYDPEHPQERVRQAGLPAALKSSTGRLPGPVPWPQGHCADGGTAPATSGGERRPRPLSRLRCRRSDVDGRGKPPHWPLSSLRTSSRPVGTSTGTMFPTISPW